MRRDPYRPSNEITQQYNDGTVRIYSLTDAAAPGYQPKAAVTHKYTLRFANRALGISRIYLSRQNQAEIQRVIRVPRADISPQDIAVTHDGKQYRIDTVQAAIGIYPPSLDLSLRLVTEKLEGLPL